MPYQADIIKHKKVSLNDMKEGEYVINEFRGKIKGVLKLNGKLHTTLFFEQTNKAPLKSESNVVINDGMSDRIIIGDIGKTKDGALYGMKVSTPGHNARFANKQNLLLDTSTSVQNVQMMFCHNFADDLGTTTHYLPWSDQSESVTTPGASGTITTGFLTPYKMTLKKIIWRHDIVSQQADVTFKVYRTDSGDNTEDTIATAEYDATIYADTTIELNRSDFDNIPEVPANVIAALSIHTDADIDQGGMGYHHFITSLWDVEVVL